MLHHTKGIVLKSVKYSDTSLIVTIYTELFGLQTYLLNGVRSSKNSSTKANLFQPSTMLELIVYHNATKNFQRIKEAKMSNIVAAIQASIVKNTITMYMTELISKCIVEQENNLPLYEFFDESFSFVHTQPETLLANYPLFFTIQMCNHLGFALPSNYAPSNNILDLANSQYAEFEHIASSYFASEQISKIIFSLTKNNYLNIANIQLNKHQRIEIINTLLTYLKLHIPHFQPLKSVEILHEILN